MAHVLLALLKGPLHIRGSPSRADVASAVAAADAARAAVAADVHVVSAQALADKAAALVADTQRSTATSGRTPDSSVLRAASQAAGEAAAELASATALAEEVHQVGAACARADALGAQFRSGVSTQVAVSSAWWLMLALASRAALGGVGKAQHAGVDARAARAATAATSYVDHRVQRLARDVLGATRQAGGAGGGRGEHSRAGKATTSRQAAPDRRKAAPPPAAPPSGPLSSWRAAVEASREVPLGAGVSWSEAAK